jgi:hypothetical protein
LTAAGRQPPKRWYAPLRDEPALFRTFADTEATEAGVLQFANRFGLLGGHAAFMFDVRGPFSNEEDDFDVRNQAEPLSNWIREILAMRQAVALWDIASGGDRAGLADLFIWTSGVLTYRPRREWTVNVGHEWPARLDPLLREGENSDRYRRIKDDAIGAAMLAVETLTNTQLSLAILPRLVENLRTGWPVLRYVPNYLLGALWCQFTTAVNEGRRYRTCRQCGNWFELPQRGSRIGREFCSNACRFKAYRGRQERARELHAQGKTFKEIAQEFETDVKTVKGWILKHKG